MGNILTYVHHGTIVKVDDELKGKHRGHCLCWRCNKFVPEDREKNREIANKLYDICVEYNLVTPVYECRVFDEQ